MDNVCHTLVGVAIARAGLQTKTALATVTAAVAANLPDLDVLVFATDVPSVAVRRGITHGVPAQLLLPVALAGLMWLIGRRRTHAGTAPPPHFGWLLGLSSLGVLTHVYLDLMNSYGVRLLSPLSPRWFYGDAVFIVDIWLWLMLGVGVLVARRTSRPRAAAVALALASLYVAGMLFSARVARGFVVDAWIARTGRPPHALMVGPVPLTPFQRTVIVDDGDRYFEGRFHWFPARVSIDSDATPKNDASAVVGQARTHPRVSSILVWSRFPVWETRAVPGGVEVRLQDMRFRGLGRGFSATTVISQ